MTIDIQNSQVVIYDEVNNIDDITKSQLYFWNFSYDHKSNHYSIEFDELIFQKVLNYFSNEKIEFLLGPTAQKKLNELEKSIATLESIKQEALNFKNGKFDRAKFEEFREFVLKNVMRKLKIHQLKAAYHLYILGHGANFSVPGSGKTSVVLTVYEKLRSEGKVNVLFVVGPPASFGPWKNEFEETLGRKPNSIILAGGNKFERKNNYYGYQNLTSELYLTSFHTLLYDQEEVNLFLKNVKAFLIIDEAHYIKQIQGNWAKAVLKQSEQAINRCILTGTPLPKSYTDIFNLFEFLWPKYNIISQREKTIIKHNERNKINTSTKQILNNKIGPLFYRVRKKDLNLMPQNFIAPIEIEMHKQERIIYDAIYQKIKNYSQQDYFKNIKFIEAIGRGRMIRLRQAVSYSKLLNSSIDDYNEDLTNDLSNLKNLIRRYDQIEVPAKINRLIKLITTLQRKKLKVVIWSNFIETLKLIEKHIKNEGFYCKKIYGSTPIEGNSIKEEETREKIRDEFVNPKSGLDILIANPAACSESISLHKTCHNAIYYDLSYNCAQYLQSLDRIHRVGGSEYKDANYYFLQYKDTIDKDIKLNIDSKSKKMFELIEKDYTVYSLNMEEANNDIEAYKRIFGKRLRK